MRTSVNPSVSPTPTVKTGAAMAAPSRDFISPLVMPSLKTTMPERAAPSRAARCRSSIKRVPGSWARSRSKLPGAIDSNPVPKRITRRS